MSRLVLLSKAASGYFRYCFESHLLMDWKRS